MNILSLTYSELERLLRAFAIFTIAIAATVFLVRWKIFDAALWTASWQGLSLALSASTLVFGFCSRMTWKSKMLASWLGRPIIHGLWSGTLHTNYRDSDGRTRPPALIFFAIKQTYLTLSIESFTDTQQGESTIEAISRNAKTDGAKVSYIFELRRQYSGENKLTTGSGELRLLDSGMRLKGHYFTNSPTQGDLELRLVSRNCAGVDSFEAAQAHRKRISSDKLLTTE